MRRTLTLVLILLTLALSGARFVDYGGPVQAPTPDPDSFDLYENQRLGVSLHYPNQWNLTPSSAPDEWLLACRRRRTHPPYAAHRVRGLGCLLDRPAAERHRTSEAGKHGHDS